jgi:hypothetical protein
MEKSDLNIAYVELVSVLMGDEVGVGNTGESFREFELRSMNVHLHAFFFEELGDSLHRKTKKVSADVVGMGVGCEDSLYVHSVTSRNGEEFTDVPGRIDDQGFLRFSIPD